MNSSLDLEAKPALEALELQINGMMSAASINGFPLIKSPGSQDLTLLGQNLLAFVGPSGAGKTHIATLLTKQENNRVISGTTREVGRNGTEAASSYIQFPTTLDLNGVTYQLGQDGYLDALRQNYGLAESNIYGGNAYGTPWSSFQNALLNGNKFAVWVAEPNGVAQVKQGMIQRRISMLPVCIVPTDVERIWVNVKERNNPIVRLENAKSELAKAMLGDYLLLVNPNGQAEDAAEQIRTLISRYAEQAFVAGNCSLILNQDGRGSVHNSQFGYHSRKRHSIMDSYQHLFV